MKQLPPKKPLPPPFSIRFTDEERDRLDRDCGDLTLSAHIREKLFGDEVSFRGRRLVRKSRCYSVDQEALARVLAALGRSQLSSNMNKIAKAANIGALPLTPELISDLEHACSDIHEMRRDLIAALQLKDSGQ